MPNLNKRKGLVLAKIQMRDKIPNMQGKLLTRSLRVKQWNLMKGTKNSLEVRVQGISKPVKPVQESTDRMLNEVRRNLEKWVTQMEMS